MHTILTGLILFTSATLVSWLVFWRSHSPLPMPTLPASILPSISTPTPTPSSLRLLTPPIQKVLPGGTHVFQSFNNCGPASLSMALSLYGITVSQQELGQSLRPYQNTAGDNDDKSVTLEQVGKKSQDYGFTPFLRPGGTMDILKLFLTYDMPVVVRTTTKPSEDIGHFRVIKGYNDTTGEIIQNDSLQGKDLRFTYDAFNTLWQIYNYEFLVLVPQEKLEIAQAILGPLVDEKVAWMSTAEASRATLKENPNNLWAQFNLSVALYHAGEYRESTIAFEQVESRLPFRTLWYQIEPIQAYYELGEYDRVFALTDKILNNENRAFSELYIIRGNIYKALGNIEAARNEFEKAVLYNANLQEAHDALSSL